MKQTYYLYLYAQMLEVAASIWLCDEKYLKSKSKYLFCVSNQGPYASVYNRLSCEWIVLPHRRFSLISFFKLLKFCVKHKIKVVHSHGRGAGIYSRFLKIFIKNIKVIHTFHGINFNNTFAGKLKVFVDRTLNYFTSTLVFVSDSELEEARNLNLLKKKNEQNKVIYNGINILEIRKKVYSYKK